MRASFSASERGFVRFRGEPIERVVFPEADVRKWRLPTCPEMDWMKGGSVTFAIVVKLLKG